MYLKVTAVVKNQTANAVMDFHKLTFNMYRYNSDLSKFTENIQPAFAITPLK